jgi:hypothetical protein
VSASLAKRIPFLLIRAIEWGFFGSRSFLEGDFKVRHVALLSRFQITLQKRPNDRPSSYLARVFEKVEGRNQILTLQITYVDHVPVEVLEGDVIAGFHPKK